MSQNNFRFHISSDHKRPVAAGTVVTFTIDDDEHTDNTFQNYEITWHIDGPFATMSQVFSGEARFDWDTEGSRAGSYTIWANLVPPGSGNGGDSNGFSEPAESETVPAEMMSFMSRTERLPEPRHQETGGQSMPNGRTKGPDVGQDAEPWRIQLTPSSAVNQEGILPVSLQRTGLADTPDQALWVVIRDRTNAIGFRSYQTFLDGVMSGNSGRSNARLPFRGGDAYTLLKFATDAFLLQEVGTVDNMGALRNGVRSGGALLDSEAVLQNLDEQLNDPAQAEALRAQEERRLGRPLNLSQLKRMRDSYFLALKDEIPVPGVLPYLRIIRERLADVPIKPATSVPGSAYGILPSHLTAPLAIELIWSYWQEEGMLAQTLNAILARFQNRRVLSDGRPDPLSRFDIDPLRPLGNIFWGWMQDEVHRLTVRRRHLEYEHQYGLPLHGRALRGGAAPVERRSKFLEAFHNLLYLTVSFHEATDNTTMIADGFPVLNALRETHLLLAEGAHNQFGDLPATARSEMMVMQWMLARPELRDFLGGRTMVPYEETWMDRVDSMKTLQGWTDVSITHFRDMAVFGEQILLSVRYGNWSVENDPQTAANWARYWRAEIQRYVHAYRAATGVDLVEVVDNTPPAVLLRRRMAAARRSEVGTRRPAALDGARRPQLTGQRETAATNLPALGSVPREMG